MTITELKNDAMGVGVLTRAGHVVAAIVGAAAVLGEDVQKVEASEPWVAGAIAAGEAAATAKGIPVSAIIAGAEQALAWAKTIDSTSPPTSAPAAGSPADPTVNPPPAPSP